MRWKNCLSAFETSHPGVPRGARGEIDVKVSNGRERRTAFELHAGKPYRRQLVEFRERVYFMPIRPGGARQAKLDPKWQDAAFIGIRDRSDEIDADHDTQRSVQDEECSETPRIGALGLEVPHDVQGYAVEPECGGGRDGSRCTSRGYGNPDASTRQSLRSWWRRHWWTVQRARCTSGDPMCRKMVTA